MWNLRIEWHDRIQRKLLGEPSTLTYACAFNLLVLLKPRNAIQKTSKLNSSRTTLLEYSFITSHPPPRHSKPSFPRTPSTTNSYSTVSCYRCGGPHLANAWSYCKKEGHLQKVCRSKLRATTTTNPSSHSETVNRPQSRRPHDPKGCHFADVSHVPQPAQDSEEYELFQLRHPLQLDPILLKVSIASDGT